MYFPLLCLALSLVLFGTHEFHRNHTGISQKSVQFHRKNVGMGKKSRIPNRPVLGEEAF